MSRLHKVNNISFVKKCYIFFALLIIYGCYKNGIVPIYNGEATIWQALKVFSLPLLSIVVGRLYDKLFNNNEIFNNTFYSVLFSMIIPISTNILIYVILLSLMLFLMKYLKSKKIDLDINFIVIGKLLLILSLFIFNNYSYANTLENSGLFQYTFVDSLFGSNVSGLFISNIVLILIGYIVLFFDYYYKKEIPLISYGTYLIVLIIYTLFKGDLAYFLQHIFVADILFAIIMVATLSCFSPYKVKQKIVYSILI